MKGSNIMTTGTRLAGLLLLTSSLTFPGVLHAQAVPVETDPPAQDVLDDQTGSDDEYEQPDISVPGGGIIVTGRRGRNPERSSTQVLNVLS